MTRWPNLDDMTELELLEFARAANLMREYAERRADALKARRDGRNKMALALETRCRDLREMLPEETRWTRKDRE